MSFQGDFYSEVTAPLEAGGKESVRQDAEAFAFVYSFMQEHLSKINKIRIKGGKCANHLTQVIADINGTLDGSGLDVELYQFMYDWHKAGLPIAVMTGEPSQKIPKHVQKLIQKSGRDVFVKPSPLAETFSGIAFDDDECTAKTKGVTPVWMPSNEAGQFLRSWLVLNLQQKKKILTPFVSFHKHHSLGKPMGPQDVLMTWPATDVVKAYNAITAVNAESSGAMADLCLYFIERNYEITGESAEVIDAQELRQIDENLIEHIMKNFTQPGNKAEPLYKPAFDFAFQGVRVDQNADHVKTFDTGQG